MIQSCLSVTWHVLKNFHEMLRHGPNILWALLWSVVPHCPRVVHSPESGWGLEVWNHWESNHTSPRCACTGTCSPACDSSWWHAGYCPPGCHTYGCSPARCGRRTGRRGRQTDRDGKYSTCATQCDKTKGLLYRSRFTVELNSSSERREDTKTCLNSFKPLTLNSKRSRLSGTEQKQITSTLYWGSQINPLVSSVGPAFHLAPLLHQSTSKL